MDRILPSFLIFRNNISYKCPYCKIESYKYEIFLKQNVEERVMKLTNLILFTIVFVLLMSFCNAAGDEFNVDVEAINTTILLDQSAVVDVTITNFADMQDFFTISTVAADWTISEPRSTLLDPAEAKTLRIYVKPRKKDKLFELYGLWSVQLSIQSRNNPKNVIDQWVSIRVTPYELYQGEYVPAVKLVLNMNETFNPEGGQYVMDVYMINRNALDIQDLTVLIQGDLFSKEYKTELSPLSEKTNTVYFDIDPFQTPGTYNVKASLIYEDNVIREESRTFTVTGNPKIKIVNKTEKRIFLRTIKSFTLVNDGNDAGEKKVNFETSYFERIFTTADPKAKYEDSKLKWEIVLEPKEAKTVTVIRDYTILFVIAVILLLIIIAYFAFRSPILIQKEAIIENTSEEGGVSRIKIKIFFKNRSRKAVTKLNVTDKLPRIANLIEEKNLGTLIPSKVIKHEKRGTVLKWSVESIEGFEERIITYRAKSKLQIVGGISLPPSKVSFETSSGKERSIFSNNVNIST